MLRVRRSLRVVVKEESCWLQEKGAEWNKEGEG